MFWVDLGNTVNTQKTNSNSKTNSKQQQIASNCTENNFNQSISNRLFPGQIQQLQHHNQKLACGIVRIERSDMDGSKRTVLVSSQLGNPVGLTTIGLGTSSSYQYSSYASLLTKQTEDVCSLKHLKVIWIDSKLGTLEMVDLDGSNRRVLVKKLKSPMGMILYF